MHTVDLSSYGIQVPEILRNASTPVLYEQAIRFESGTRISATGALVAYSGAKTGRSPSDKRVVQHPASEGHIWWGNVNHALDEHTFALNRARALDYLNTRDRLYVVDAFADGVAAHLGRSRDTDAIHANYWLSGVAGHRLKHELSLPLVSTFHTLARVKADTGDEEPDVRITAETS
ncbi:MAG: phosphoenolpyruvate carboxykinase (ATP), partial [Verrucomicrobia bacterium]|nr:phosphoenolpyruvate carboxykinase (ATP) [Verrucomicrobiota bacterium]